MIQTTLFAIAAVRPAAARLIGILLICAALEALIAFFLIKKKKGLKIAAAILSLCFAFAAALFALSAWQASAEEPETDWILAEAGDPRRTAEAFCEAVCAKDYASAYRLLAVDRSLGLEYRPEDEAARLLCEALADSYRYRLWGNSSVDGLVARQSLSLTRLEPAAMREDLRAGAEEYLSRLCEEQPRALLADEEGRYLPEISREAALHALRLCLEEPERYTVTTELELRLCYTGAGWRILPDEALLNALAPLGFRTEGGGSGG